MVCFLIIIVLLAIVILDSGYTENYSEQRAGQQQVKTSKNKINDNKMTPENTTPVHIYEAEVGTTPVFTSDFVNTKAMSGNNAAFDRPRHGGSVGYLNADSSNFSSQQNLNDAKQDVIENHYMRENLRRERMVEGYSRKRENDHRHYLEASGYEPPNMQNNHYFREDVPARRNYNGYAIL